MKQFRYIHFIQLDKFTKGYISFIKESFLYDEHLFLIEGTEGAWDISAEENIRFESCWQDFAFGKQYRTLILDCDKIFLNGVFSGREKIFLFFAPSILRKKVHLFFWGADLYILDRVLPWYRIRVKMSVWLKKFVFKHAYAVITLIDSEQEELEKRVHPKGKKFVAPMAGSSERASVALQFFGQPKMEDPYYILLGNSADPSNGHMQMLDVLSQYKAENIKVFCPLSYAGNPVYADEVIAHGTACLGEKFVPLTEYMEYKQYIGLLAKCSVVVMNQNRQQAMGNINTALLLGGKVYLRTGTSMWQWYKDTQGYHVFDVATIASLPFDAFLALSEDEKTQNSEKRKALRDQESRIKQWQVIFEDEAAEKGKM